MKGFTREEPLFSQCGLNCGLCTMYLGNYCPGCGGTRAAYALLCGKPLLSLYYHPIVLYTVVVGAAFLVTQTIGRLSRGRFRAVVHFRPVYLWIALALVVINCFVKNFILLYFHIPLL